VCMCVCVCVEQRNLQNTEFQFFQVMLVGYKHICHITMKMVLPLLSFPFNVYKFFIAKILLLKSFLLVSKILTGVVQCLMENPTRRFNWYVLFQ